MTYLNDRNNNLVLSNANCHDRTVRNTHHRLIESTNTRAARHGHSVNATHTHAACIENSPLLSRIEAAKYIGVCPQTLAVWASTGRYGLPMVKIGRYAKYRKEDLDRFIESNIQGGEVLQ